MAGDVGGALNAPNALSTVREYSVFEAAQAEGRLQERIRRRRAGGGGDRGGA